MNEAFAAWKDWHRAKFCDFEPHHVRRPQKERPVVANLVETPKTPQSACRSLISEVDEKLHNIISYQ